MPGISFSGLASGIDGDAVIKALTDARRQVSIPIQNKIADNEAESKAYAELNTKLLSMNDALQKFRALTGGAISKHATTSDETSLNASAGSNALPSTTTVKVVALAKGSVSSFDDLFSSPDTPIAANLTGSVDLNIAVGTGTNQKNITAKIDNTTTLASLVSAINSDTSDAAFASVVNVGTASTPQYKLVIASSKTGTDAGALAITVPDELTSIGIFASKTSDDAQDAQVFVQGIGTVSRATNQIADLIPGVTLNLKAPGGTLQVTVSNDSEDTAKAFGEVITAYNEIVKFRQDNNKIERLEGAKGATNVFGALAHGSLDEQLLESLRSAISGARSGVDGSPIQSLADLGLATQRDGTVSYDPDKFKSAVGTDPLGVSGLLTNFSETLGKAGGIIFDYTKFQGYIESALTANTDDNKRLNEKIESLERSIEKQTENLKKSFAALESKIARLNENGNALSSLIGSVGKN